MLSYFISIKRHQLVIAILLCINTIPKLYSQDFKDTIEISYTKSAYLIFNNANIKFDNGSEEDIIVRQNDNKLIIQAAQEDFEESTLLVEAQNTLMLFLIRYSKKPKNKLIFNYSDKISTIDSLNAINFNNNNNSNSPKIQFYCSKIINNNQTLFNEGAVSYGCVAFVPLIYTDGTNIYIKIAVENTTHLPYDVDYLNYQIRTKRKNIKQNSTQDYQIQSLYEHNKFTRLEGKSTNTMIAVLPKFTIDKTKVLSIEIWEKNGDRRITINIDGQTLLKVLPI